MNDQQRFASNATKLPPQAYAIAPAGARGKIVRIDRGDTRYSVADTRILSDETPEQAVERLNAALNVTPAQREAMVSGSIFGFHTPAADPDSYEANGETKREIVANDDPRNMRDLLHEKSGERKSIKSFVEWLIEHGHGIEFVEDLDLETLMDEYHGIDRERLEIEEKVVAATTR